MPFFIFEKATGFPQESPSSPSEAAGLGPQQEEPGQQEADLSATRP
jgi:hypothetical protein